MPWSIRSTRIGDSVSLRRHSTMDPTSSDEQDKHHDQLDTHHLAPEHLESLKAPSPLRNSFEPSDGEESAQSRTLRDQPPKRHRFSMLQYRHKSDPQISKTARDQAAIATPPIPTAPSIITTAPPETIERPQNLKTNSTLPRGRRDQEPAIALAPKKSIFFSPESSSAQYTRGQTSANSSARESRLTFDEPERSRGLTSPPAYGDDSTSSLALPITRLSESSRSDGSLGDHGLYATTTTTHTVSTTTTFFKLPRRKKNKGPLFPLPIKMPTHDTSNKTGLAPRGSIGAHSLDSPSRQSPSRTPPLTAVRQPLPAHKSLPSPLPSPSYVYEDHSRSNLATLIPSNSSSPVSTEPIQLSQRGRASTKGSLKQSVDDDPLPTPPLPNSGRTSSSTGRASLGGLFNLSRLRQNSEPQQSRHGLGHLAMPGTPISAGSKSQSFSLNREPVTVPEKQDGDTPAKYLIRLEEAVSRGVVATIVSQSNDEFFKNVLRSYMRGFKFFGDPLDMSTRKLLMEVELPKETQQIDRVLQAFANRYHECNPGVYASPDEAYFIAFSILILHTDVFNKNNKHKMQKCDYTKNARGQGVAEEILECFYDNISYTPFIHVEDDLDINGERFVARKSRKKLFARPSTDPLGKPSREPVDPYTLILDNRLDSLRPALKDTMNLEDHYNYLGTAPTLNLANLHKTFFKSGVLQIVSSRSRPEAFMSPSTMANPAEAHPGVVDIKVTKVGILWRKDMKKKKARSPWQEWGAILTGAQLYFFRDTAWVKSLMHQHNSHHRHGYAGSPVVFKPPLQQFKPDVLMSTQDAVALVDETYKRHKHSVLFVRHGGFEEVFLADSEADMNDWLAKLNYAAAFRTAGIRIRGMIGGTSDGERPRAAKRMDSNLSARSNHNTAPETMAAYADPELELFHQIQAARRQIMSQKIAEADMKLNEAGKQLEVQLRNARHLLILAPIQNRTREQVILAAGGMAAKIKWMRLENWRTRCHRDILAMELEEDIRLGGDLHVRTDQIPSAVLAAVSPEGPKFGRKDAGGVIPTTPQTTRQGDAITRPATQPSPGKSFSMDDVFASMHVTSSGSKHMPKGSWELPPLSFQPSRGSMKSSSSLGTNQPTRHPLVPQASSRSVSDSAHVSTNNDEIIRLATPSPRIDSNEQEVLYDAGIVTPEVTPDAKAKRPETPTGSEAVQEAGKTMESEINEPRSRVRRSLHRTLRDSHPPSHHRSKRGKDSAGSTGLAEDGSSVADSEGLARGTGSFTVHGKKASVITFGSEWQNMTPEERLKIRKQSHNDESKLSVPSAIDDESSSIRSAYYSTTRPRPVSSVSASTATSATSKSAPVEEVVAT